MIVQFVLKIKKLFLFLNLTLRAASDVFLCPGPGVGRPGVSGGAAGREGQLGQLWLLGNRSSWLQFSQLGAQF